MGSCEGDFVDMIVMVFNILDKKKEREREIAWRFFCVVNGKCAALV